ncbi:MAG: CtsR family transcriptional regulator, partial [Aerococcus viridans]
PSQINYVINTRFTPQKGYIVESKRGGGGYIRIMKLEIVDEADLIDAMVDLIKGKTSLSDATAIIQNLLVNEIVTENEAQIIHSAIDKDALGKIVNADEIRSLILEAMLVKLKYR